jgi:Ni,Fe-hydrogenase III component G
MNAEELIQRARTITEEWLWKTTTEQTTPDHLSVWLSTAKDLIPIVAMLRVQRMGYLAAITGLDMGAEAGEMEALYHFCTGPVTVTLRVKLPRQDPSLPSLSQIIPSAEPLERELQEMYGIRINGLRNPTRLYLSDDWPQGVYPMRKDYQPDEEPLGMEAN